MDLTNAKSLVSKLHSHGKRGYIVGGWCRDRFFGRDHSGFLDIATDATPEEITGIFGTKQEIGQKYGSLIIEEGGEIFEITSFRRDIGSVNFRKPAEVEFTTSLEEDAFRRDLTMNAIYYDPITDEFLDPTGGIEDIRKKRIRFIGNAADRLDEDILRALRYVRFRARYHLTGDMEDTIAIRKKIGFLRNLPIERIRTEFDLILGDVNSNIEGLKILKETDFFKTLLQEVDVLSETPGGPPYHLEGSVWTHTLGTVAHLNEMEEVDLTLLYAGLFHDIGKAVTIESINGEIHYYDHEIEGEKLFLGLAGRWKFPNRTKKSVAWMIRWHLRVGQLPWMRVLKARRFMMHPLFPRIFALGKADLLAQEPGRRQIIQEIEAFYRNFLAILAKKRFFTGEDIKKQFPELTGPEIGKRLKDLNDEILLKD